MAEEGKTQQILIRFRGICAHVDVKDGEEPGGTRRKKKRTILLRHRNGDANIEHHTAHIEFFADDVDAFSPDLNVVSYSRVGVDGRLARVDLADGTIIRLKNTRPGFVMESASYGRDVPHFTKILPEQNRAIAAGLVGDIENLDTDRAVAAFDMPEGILVAGEPEGTITRFQKSVSFPPQRLARWAELHATVAEEPIEIELVTKADATRRIQFKDSLRMLTIGNEPERLILGLLPESVQGGHSHGDSAIPPQPSGHFILYYDLLENPPKDRAVPIPTQLGGAGCTNSNYP
ncbi:MAG: hypothetical protein QOH21_129 [Acidobacteriota bacterium]|jgi:hypothetical protein|nr:hypothetical protein [Acidobacteriota bacterium]